MEDYIGVVSYTKDAPIKIVVVYYDSTTTYIGKAKRGTPLSAARWEVQKMVRAGIDYTQTDAQASNGSFHENIMANYLTLNYV